MDGGYSEEARTRGFASPTLAGFAFIDASMKLVLVESILAYAYQS